MNISNRIESDPVKVLDSWIEVFHSEKESRHSISSCSDALESFERSYLSEDENDVNTTKIRVHCHQKNTGKRDVYEKLYRDGRDSAIKKAKVMLDDYTRSPIKTPASRRKPPLVTDEERDSESVYDILYNDIRKLQIVDENRDQCSPLSAKATPTKVIPLSKAVALYERGMQAKAAAEEKRNKAKEESTITPSKTITLSDADAVYKRGMIFKAKIAMKRNKDYSDEQRSTTPTKKIPLSEASALYDRAIKSKAEAIRKREAILLEDASVLSNSTISLSQATGIYERGIRMKTMQKLKNDLESIKSLKPSKTIPLSQAAAIYDRAIRSKSAALRRRLEEEQMVSPSKTISLSKATAIYERGMQAKANAVRKRQENMDNFA